MIVRSPSDTVQLIGRYTKSRQENFGVIALDEGLNVIGSKVLFKGTSRSCNVDQKMIFWYAFQKKASAIIVFHNHPSGNPLLSEDDVKTTESLKGACDIVGVQLMDHVIVSRTGIYSFREHDNVLGVTENLNVAEV